MTTYSGKYWRVVAVCLAVIVLAAGCKKSGRDLAEQKALDRHEWETKQKNALIKEIRGPHQVQMMEGLRFLQSLAEHDHLPGISRHGEGGLSSVKIDVPPGGPFFLTEEFHIYILSQPPLYLGYEIGQTYSNADYQLLRAWSTDVAGKVIEKFPVIPAPVEANPRWFFWGPANPGAEIGFAHWYNGVLGGGSISIDDDPATGLQDFKIGIKETATTGTNHADLRSEMFSLEKYTKESGPLTFSFHYKLPGKIKPGDNLDIALRFFGPDNDNFLGQEVCHVGSSTGDSEMTEYKTMTLTNIFPSAGAVKADVWVVANIFGPWTSGDAEFDDFSVTTAVPRHWGPMVVKMGLGLGLGIVVVVVVLWIRSVRRARAGA